MIEGIRKIILEVELLENRITRIMEVVRTDQEQIQIATSGITQIMEIPMIEAIRRSAIAAEMPATIMEPTIRMVDQ